MSDAPAVSVVIVSRDRPQELRLVLSSLRFLTYPRFEVVVVANSDPRVDFADLHGISSVKHVHFDEPNISAARNAGIVAAAGEIIAFCDDDAVPEPTWLTHLIAPFADLKVAAAGGFVRGRNGISFQWRGRSFDRLGNHHDLDMAGTEPQVFAGDAQRGIKTEGTNCAFRRDALASLGGFDENFVYFLDETDVNYRLGLAGLKTAIVPLAQVHHGFARSPIRTANRAPKDLFEIGASTAYFCKIHGNISDVSDLSAVFYKKQNDRLIEFMVKGTLEPRDIGRLMRSYSSGLRHGLIRQPKDNPVLSSSERPAFLKYDNDGKTAETLALAGRPLYWRRMRVFAEKRSKTGSCVTVFRFSLTSAYHRVGFKAPGYWQHEGGLFGRADRGDKIFSLSTVGKRARRELAKLAKIRPAARLVCYPGKE